MRVLIISAYIFISSILLLFFATIILSWLIQRSRIFHANISISGVVL